MSKTCPTCGTLFHYKPWQKRIFCSKTCVRRTEEHKKIISYYSRNRHFTEEHKRNISLGKLGKKLSKETRERMSKAHRGMLHTEEEKRKISEANSGPNHYNWKGGITRKQDKIRDSRAYRSWRTAVFKRDNYTCVWCGARNGNGKSIYLNADHIKQFAYYPDLRFELSNGRTLCLPCHKKTESYVRQIKT